jgi:hypothetical protein
VLHLPLNFLASQLTAPSSGAVEEVTVAASNIVELNPFGTWLTVLTWASLLSINFWCFRRILRQSEEVK